MQVAYEKTDIRDVYIVKPEVFEDSRGFFTEVYRQDQYSALGLPANFVQFNHSGSVRNTVRGLHFQWEPPMGKLMRVSAGEAFLVAVDIRKGSPTLGRHVSLTTSSRDRSMLWAPAGFARGFAVLSDYAEIQYLCTGTYSNKGESGVLWNDPKIGVAWPVAEPLLSDKDRVAQSLAQWLERPESNHFTY